MAITQALLIGKGETLTINMEYQDKAGTPVDLTGYTADLIVSKRNAGAVVGTYPATVDAEGNIEVKVADEVTALWAAGIYSYKVVLSFPNGDKRWLLTGRLTVKGDDE